MKKYIIKYFILTFIFGLIIIPPVFAQTAGSGPAINVLTNSVATKGGYDTKDVTTSTLYVSVGNIIKTVLGMTGTIFLVLTVYAGILWMTAAGKDERVEKATKILSTAVVGLIIIMSAYVITYFVTSRL